VLDAQGPGSLTSGTSQNPVKSKRDFLRSVALFERLPHSALDRLALSFERHKYADGDVVFHQGDRGDRLYLAEFGTVDLMRTDAGHTHRLARVEAGGYFGELALLSDQPRAATAECVGDVELLSISGRELKRLLAESAPALRSIIGNIKEYKPPERPPTFWEKLRGRRS
jgi:CRP/FNR family cyclic AMP-dependent transcriptional regulator